MRILRIFAAMMLLLSSASAQTDAAVPRLINYSGNIADENGTPRNGPIGLTIAIYSSRDGGAPLWLETQTVNLDSSGRYRVLIGATKAEGLPIELFATSEERWLGVKPENQDEQPRVLLVSVPYALHAGDAQTIGGLTSAQLVKLAQASSATGVVVPNAALAPDRADRAGRGSAPAPAAPGERGSFFSNEGSQWILEAFNDATNSPLQLLLNPKGGNVGIGTTTPGERLSVAGTIQSTNGGFKFPDATLQSSAGVTQVAADARYLKLSGGTLTGALTVNSLSGNGSGLTNVNAATLNGYSATAFSAAVHGHDISQVLNAASIGTNSFNGNQNVTGSIAATGTISGQKFVGDGSQLSNLSCVSQSEMAALQSQIAFMQVYTQNLVATTLPSGAHIWSRRFGGPLADTPKDVAVDKNGNIIVTGLFSSAVDFGTGLLPSAGGYDIFVAKFTADGALLWVKRFGGTGNDIGSSVAVDPFYGNIYVAGGFSSVVNFGGGELTAEGAFDHFVMKLAPDGSHLWSKRLATTRDQVVPDVTVDQSLNVIVAGSFTGAANFGGGVLSSAGLDDIYAVKFDSLGAHMWSRRFGDTNNQTNYSVAVDSAGDVILAGSFSGTLDFYSANYTSIAEFDSYVVKLSRDYGFHVWSRRYPNGGGYASVDSADNVLVTGYFAGSTDFGGGTLIASGQDVFIVKLNSGGAHQWSKNFGDAGNQSAIGISADAVGNIVLGGQFRGSLDFGGGILTASGGDDGFLAKFTPSGTHVWSKSFGSSVTSSHDSAGPVAFDGNGDVLAIGAIFGTTDLGGGYLTSAGSSDILLLRLRR